MMVELIFSFIFEILFNVAVYLPGLCISLVTGRSAKDFSEHEVVGISLAFWGVVIMLCLVGWAVVSWLNVGTP